ncbi:MAG: MopE-related protein [Flavobacteriales bacterium]
MSGAFAALKRDYPAFGPDATWFNLDVGSYGKRMRFEHSAGDAVVVGNFKTTGIDMVPGFTHTGTWYDFLSGESINVTDLDAAMPFAPGELHVFTDTPLDTPVLQEIDVDLDGQLASEGDCNDHDATVYTGAVDIALDGIDQDCDGEDALTSVSEHVSEWSLYPNPTADVLTFRHSASDMIASVQLVDATGRRLDVPTEAGLGALTLDLSSLADGVDHLTWAEAGRVFSTPVHKMNR